MRRLALGGLALVLLARPAEPLEDDSRATADAAQSPAPAPPSTQLRPALYVLATAERGNGAAYAPPLDRLKRDDAASLGFGLDLRHAQGSGKLEASVFGLAHDPASSKDRGYFLAARARATFRWGDWALRLEDAPRLNRRNSVELSDFDRNEVWLEVQRRIGGPSLGVRIGDRRRSVRKDPLQGFARQSLSASLAGGSAAGTTWRVEAGPQYFDTEVAHGWRLASALELVARVLRVQTALRVLWIEPLHSGNARSGTAAAPASPTPTPPPPLPTPPPVEPPTYERTPAADTVAPGEAPQFSPPPPPQLVSPLLAVDPLEGDEAEWDFGRRKQEVRLVLAGRLPLAVSASLELRAQRERGPDLTVIGPEVDVRRDRLVLRGSLRRLFGRRLALLAEASWQGVRDNRPGFAHSRSIVALGIELRP